MFQWDKSIKTLEVASENVVHLFRSMREVQLALPGVSAQQASAYLCQYKQGDGIATVAAFHLHKSEVLAFYFAEPRIVPESKVDSMLDQGLNFVESMGFLLTDQDIHLLDAADQEMLWESLPLKAGIPDKEETVAAPPPAKAAETEPLAGVPKHDDKIAAAAEALKIDSKGSIKPKKAEEPSVEPAKSRTADEPDEASENVDDLLAAVEAMRAKRPGLRARKVAPSPEEMNRRKQQLQETIGRILATL